MSNDNLMMVIDDQAYPVVNASPSVTDEHSGAIHSLEVPWEAPFVGRAQRIELMSGEESRPIKVVAARFRDGNQRVAFRYE